MQEIMQQVANNMKEYVDAVALKFKTFRNEFSNDLKNHTIEILMLYQMQFDRKASGQQE